MPEPLVRQRSAASVLTTPDPAVVSRVFLFRDLEPEELERLAFLLHEKTFPAGASVITAEQPGGAVYVILEGSVKVHLPATGATNSHSGRQPRGPALETP